MEAGREDDSRSGIVVIGRRCGGVSEGLGTFLDVMMGFVVGCAWHGGVF